MLWGHGNCSVTLQFSKFSEATHDSVQRPETAGHNVLSAFFCLPGIFPDNGNIFLLSDASHPPGDFSTSLGFARDAPSPRSPTSTIPLLPLRLPISSLGNLLKSRNGRDPGSCSHDFSLKPVWQILFVALKFPVVLKKQNPAWISKVMWFSPCCLLSPYKASTGESSSLGLGKRRRVERWRQI